MKVVILCGGMGTRIRDAVEQIPKPMLPIGNRPILWHIMKYYSCFGFNEFILCLGYKGEVIKNYFLNYEPLSSDFEISLGKEKSIKYCSSLEENWKITLTDTGLNTQTGGRVGRIRKFLKNDENFFLTYGDGLGTIDLNKLLDFHKKNKKIMTVTGVRPPGRFGEVEKTPEGLVNHFNEKPQTSAGRISGGFFVCNNKIFEYLSEHEDLVLERSPMHTLAQDKEMMLYEHDGFWQPMDTYREYTMLNDLFDRGNAPWKIW